MVDLNRSTHPAEPSKDVAEIHDLENQKAAWKQTIVRPGQKITRIEKMIQTLGANNVRRKWDAFPKTFDQRGIGFDSVPISMLAFIGRGFDAENVHTKFLANS